jgi:endonuclease YncB( thermonuclease family)
MIGNAQLRQRTDRVREISTGFDLTITDEQEEYINKYEERSVIDDSKEFVICDEEESARHVPSVSDAVPEPGSSTGLADLAGNESDARLLLGNPAPRGGPVRNTDLFFFLMPIGFASLTVAFTAIFICASLPANLPGRPTSTVASVSVAFAAPTEVPTAGQVPTPGEVTTAGELPTAGSSATASSPSESAASQPGPANMTAAEAPPIAEIMAKAGISRPSPVLTGGESAPAARPMVNGMVAGLTDAATLSIGGQEIRLQGVEPGSIEVLGPFAAWVGVRSPVECQEQNRPGLYRCVGSNGVDVGEAAILNGAGRANGDANALYRQRETEARQAHRGMWKGR